MSERVLGAGLVVVTYVDPPASSAQSLDGFEMRMSVFTLFDGAVCTLRDGRS